MINFRFFLSGLAVSLLMIIAGCKENFSEDPDPDIQRIEDIQIIEEYILENNLGQYDTTESGARYIILDSGFRDSIHYNNIVAVDFVGYSVDSSVFSTSIREIADSVFTEVIESQLQPQVFTYAETGWSVELIPLTSQFITDNGQFAGTGLAEAITEAFIHMRVGGKLLVLLPSDQAFEWRSSVFFGPYSVIIYEIYPVWVL